MVIKIFWIFGQYENVEMSNGCKNYASLPKVMMGIESNVLLSVP